MNWINAEKSLEDFLKQDLPFLVKPHCQDVIHIITQNLQSLNISIDIILGYYPNYIDHLHKQVYLYFVHYMSKAKLNKNSEFYTYYCSLAVEFQNKDIYTFIDRQFLNESIKTILSKHSDSHIIYV